MGGRSTLPQPGRVATRGLFLAGLLAFAAGCPTTNLQDRPDWAKAPRLQATHPLFVQYPEAKFLSTVAGAPGGTIETAHQASRQAALDKFAESLAGEVLAAAPAQQGGGGEGAAAYRKNVEEMLHQTSQAVLATCVEEVLTWDQGFEQKSKYYFGCYVLDKDRSWKLVMTRASGALDQIDAISKRLKDPATPPDEAERLSLEQLSKILELTLYKQVCLNLGQASEWITSLNKLEMECAQRVYDAGARREKSGSEQDVTEAYKFYTEAARFRLDPLIDASIVRVRERLPCERCKPALADVPAKTQAIEDARERIKAARGDELARLALEAVRTINELRETARHPHKFFQERVGKVEDFGPFELECVRRIYEEGDRLEGASGERDLEQALQLYQQCSAIRKDKVLDGRILSVKRKLPCVECKRSGRCAQCAGEKGRNVPCGTCNGSAKLTVTCPACDGDGKTVCPKCHGAKRLQVECGECKRTGKEACPDCGGRGSYDEQCDECRGSGKLRCGPKTPDGKSVCKLCNGTGWKPCVVCHGPGKFVKRCRSCEGKGQVPCHACGGSLKVAVNCDHCLASGRAGTCPKCTGGKTIVVECTRCKNGQVWQDCEHCKGLGTCPVCGGKAYRQ